MHHVCLNSPIWQTVFNSYQQLLAGLVDVQSLGTVVSAATRCPTNWFRGMQFRFFSRQHLKAAPAFCISLPSTFTVPVCRLLKDTGMHYFSRLFLWTMWVLQRRDLEQPLVFLHFLLQDIFAYDNTCGDCSFKLDLFLGVFTK